MDNCWASLMCRMMNLIPPVNLSIRVFLVMACQCKYDFVFFYSLSIFNYILGNTSLRVILVYCCTLI
jgi:hypothetical protein